MSKAFIAASAFLMGVMAFGASGEAASAAGAKATARKVQCDREATLQLYIGEQRSRFIRRCLAERPSPGKPVARRPGVHPSGPTASPRVMPLGSGNPPSTATGSTAPSNAAVVPSTPVVGSTGTSTTGSRATSTSGSSGSSIGSSGGGR